MSAAEFWLVWWSDGSRLVVHTSRDDAVTGILDWIQQNPTVTSYSLFEDHFCDDVPVRVLLSTGVQVLVFRGRIGDPIPHFTQEGA